MTVIQTYSGKMVDVTNLRVEQVDILDIAVSLGNLARFNGHALHFYSVAQHSVLVSLLAGRFIRRRLDAEHGPGYCNNAMVRIAERFGLLHDAHEAYLGDIPRPLTSLAPGIVDAARGIDRVIRESFGLHLAFDAVEHAVKEADEAALGIERRDLMRASEVEWAYSPVPPAEIVVLKPLDPIISRIMFLTRFVDLFPGLAPGLLVCGPGAGYGIMDNGRELVSGEVDWTSSDSALAAIERAAGNRTDATDGTHAGGGA